MVPPSPVPGGEIGRAGCGSSAVATNPSRRGPPTLAGQGAGLVRVGPGAEPGSMAEGDGVGRLGPTVRPGVGGGRSGGGVVGAVAGSSHPRHRPRRRTVRERDPGLGPSDVPGIHCSSGRDGGCGGSRSSRSGAAGRRVGSSGMEASGAEQHFNRALGSRLRTARRNRGLSLARVEQLTDSEFKASVVGAYERGERALSVHRLYGLARVYGVPVTDLLPEDPSGPEVVIDVDALPADDIVSKFLSAIQVMRNP